MTSTLTGCGVNREATIATLGDQKVSMGLVNFMCRYQQATSDDSYRAYFGDGVWTQDLSGSGTTMADSVKDQVMNQVHEYYSAKAHMDEYNVSLTDEEKQKITDTAAAFMAANSRGALKEMGATQAIVEEMLTLATIQDKVQDAIYDTVDTNVTDEEANMRAYTMVKMDTKGSYDENNAYVEYTDEQKVDIRVNATMMYEAIENGTDVETAASNSGFSATTGTYDSDDETLEEEVKTVLDGLKVGEVSDLIETENAIYLVRLDAETDKEATEKNKETIVKERQSDLYKDTLEGWQENDNWKVKERKLDAIQFKNFFTQNNGTTDSAVESVGDIETTESAE